MTYDPRTIAFVAELLFPPMQLRADLVQGVHNSLFRQPQLGYQSFQVQADGIHLTNLAQVPGQVSQASFQPDRLVVREELRGTTVEDFATRLVNVAKTAFAALSIPASMAQQFCVRSLINPKQVRDAREFLGRRLLANGEALQELGRPLQSLGLRLSLPPVEGDRAAWQARIETWPQDPRSLWIEVTSTFPTPLTLDQLPQVADHLYATYGFLTGPLSRYLERHDRPA
ncbi:MAG: hypothetical protein AB7O97_23850 [Planctomycetota bacterium]